MSSSTKDERPLYGKVLIRGVIEAITGLHIGGAREPLEIGGIDAPVVRDPVTRYPYIPGSSLKGKMRSLFERHIMAKKKKAGESLDGFLYLIGQVRIHVCSDPNCVICRLFGSSVKETNIPSRIAVRDAYLTEPSMEKLREIESPLLYTELKFENAIDRITSAAMPRQIERVPAGTEFEFEMIYNAEDIDQLEEDLKNLLFSMALLEDDYLGGHGTRGYGKIRFNLELIEAKKTDAYMGKRENNVISFDKDILERWRDNIEKIAKEIAKFFKGTSE